jgi:hypothetical protein
MPSVHVFNHCHETVTYIMTGYTIQQFEYPLCTSGRCFRVTIRPGLRHIAMLLPVHLQRSYRLASALLCKFLCLVLSLNLLRDYDIFSDLLQFSIDF